MTHEEQFIELKTAKLAKQAGFDWKINMYYYHTTVGWQLRNIRDIPEFIKGNDKCIPAPTQSVLQRWLREIKGISVEVYHEIVWVEGGTLGIKWTYRVCYLKSNKSDVLPFDEFDTYEAALEAGLQKCLTLIIEKQ